MSISNRVAIVAAVVLIAGALAAAFVPAGANGASCGTWMNPAWSRADTQEYLELLDDNAGLLGGAADVQASAAVETYQACSDSLATRKVATFVLLGLALVSAPLVFFLAPVRRSSRESVESVA